MAKRQDWWAELQLERARQIRNRLQQFREAQQAQARAPRDAARAERSRKRQAAVDERQAAVLYIEDRRAEAAAMAEDARARFAELEGLLTAGLRDRPVVTFASLRRNGAYPAFDAARLAGPLPAPVWEHFAPEEPAGRGRLFGGAARYEQQLDSARADYAQAVERYTAAEADRRRRYTRERAAYDAAVAKFTTAVTAHNAGVDQFQRDCWAADPEAVAQFCTLVLDSSVYPEGFPHQTRTVYRPGQKEVAIEWELPPPSVIPLDRDYQYLAARDAIDASPRAEQEIEELYRAVIAQVALRTVHEVLISTPGGVIERVTFYGKVRAADPAAGEPAEPLLLQVSTEREALTPYLLADPDPVSSLNRLNALLSPRPCDLEPVQPAVDFGSLSARFTVVAGVDAMAGPGSRRDVLAMTPYEFEHLVRQVFEKAGMVAWNTEAIKDDGIDAVAANRDAVFGGPCVIQAKRWRDPAGAEEVRALAGVMADKRAAKGILLTTSWVTKDGHAFASDHGRIEIMECEHVKYLCKEYLGRDVLISLSKPPPR
jgi:restriction system protein